jgi:RNA polymerase sigma-70 factor (ECF subfamily)
VAEVFMVCWRRLDELPAEPLPWLLGVARRVLSTQRRGEQRGAALRQRLAESGAAVGALSPAVGSVGAGASGALRGALEQLSESDREVLLLIAWEGLSPTEAAAVLGVKAATVRVRLHRARRRLARTLVRDGGEGGGEPLPCTPLTMEAP